MMRFLLPLILLFLGVGGGVGAGLFLAPGGEAAGEVAEGSHSEATGSEAEHDGEEPPPGQEHDAEGAEEDHAEAEDASPEEAGHEDEEPAEAATAGHEYIKLNNQFVVPILTEGEVVSLVLLSIAVEVPAGQQEAALSVEPKLRDIFLQVLFDHANAGGFDGLFTAGTAMRDLRNALLASAQDGVGEMVTDVLILDLVRQAQ